MNAMTAAQVDERSRRRARSNQLRVGAVAAFVVLALLAGAFFIQRQQNDLTRLIQAQVAYTLRMCEQRRANTLKSNANWEALAAIERHNKFIDNKLRLERLTVYENAKLAVPECGP